MPPVVVLVYVTVANAALTCATVPAINIVPVPAPFKVVLPAVAFRVPEVTSNLTNIVADPASLSAMLKPLKVVVLLMSTAKALGRVLTGAASRLIVNKLDHCVAVPK